MQKPKLLYIITQGGPWGGAQKYVFDTAFHAAKQFDVTVAVGEPDGEKDLQKKLSGRIRVIQLRHLRRNISIYHDILTFFEIKKLFQTVRPDIMHLNSSKAGIIGSIAYRLSPIETHIVYTVHGWAFNEPIGLFKRWLYQMLERATARQKEKIIVLSPEDASAAKKIGIEEHRLALIPHAVSLPRVRLDQPAARSRVCQHVNCPVPMNLSAWIGTIANFYPTKGLDILIQSFSVTPELARAHLFLIGDGPDREKLTALIRQLGLDDRVHVLGFIENAKELLPAFNVFALPSRKEGMPYALLEAMAYRVPVVATAVGGVPWIIEDKKNGFIALPNDPAALGRALVAALASASRTDIAEQALADLEKKGILCTDGETAQKTLALYETMLHDSGKI